jgi:hypothetical protein
MSRPTFRELYAARTAAGQAKADERKARADAARAKIRAAVDQSHARTEARNERLDAGTAPIRNEGFRTHGRALGITPADSARLLTAGTVAAVETGADVRGRITVTRLVALGVFALAARKRTGHVYITFTVLGGGVVKAVAVPVKHEAKARAWASEFNARTVQRAA